MTELLKSLNRAAQKQQLVTVWSAQDSKMMCLSPGKPLDGKVRTSTSTPHLPSLSAVASVIQTSKNPEMHTKVLSSVSVVVMSAKPTPWWSMI